jgi:superfamily I DNA/RNA helicase/CRISPR/Cas system-associated exonuclease Cas4 (RecB family)
LRAAARHTGIDWEERPREDSLLDGAEAVLDLDTGVIWLNSAADPLIKPFYLAHDYAHLWLEEAGISCKAHQMDSAASEEPVSLGVQRLEGYGPQERRERTANVFAREFLLPSSALRKWYMHDGLDVPAIVAHLGLPDAVIYHQLGRAVLLDEELDPAGSSQPPISTNGINPASEKHRPEPAAHIQAGAPADNTSVQAPHNSSLRQLDDSQREAAHVNTGPVLVEAGPGTGRTSTLIGRVLYLLDRNHPPSSILALTYSNRAAEEMRHRISRAAPHAAASLWVGTIHAFGLELLSKYGGWLGLPPSPAILDQVSAVSLLEQHLEALQLTQYTSLHRLPEYLRDIVRSISRAKDELVGPDDYMRLAEQQLTTAKGEDEVKLAQRVYEGARVYTFYQNLLFERGLLDFGDLICLPISLLSTYPEVRSTVRETYPHLLIDEYQDINRASAMLVRELAGDGLGLWVVGDGRQGIYQFRGASAVNMQRFPEDYPGARVFSLARNYRSQPDIVALVSHLAPKLQAHAHAAFNAWEPERAGEDGGVTMHVAEDLDAECAGIAAEIERLNARGLPYSDQAVLCRSHTLLARIAERLEAAGIPVLYLGNLFERAEIRDLLSLLSLACEGDGRGLIRVAAFPEYDMPLEDVLALLKFAQNRGEGFPGALKLAQDADDISPKGKAGIALLDQHLEGLCYGSSAWTMAAEYLFTRSRYLQDILADESISGHQKRMAIFQFLQFLQEQSKVETSGETDPKRALLQYVRRLEEFGEDKQLRHIPEWASHMNGVRLLTIHASKGLEFRAVFMPALGQSYFPARPQPSQCPTPTGLLGGQVDDDSPVQASSQSATGRVVRQEEQNLFFVGLSRARDHLCVSRAQRYLGSKSNPSDLLSLISERLPLPPGGSVTWQGVVAAEVASDSGTLEPVEPLTELSRYSPDMLDTYILCPMLYYYRFVLKLPSRREDSGYARFHMCVYSMLDWIQAEISEGRPPEDMSIQARLAEVWLENGPVGHAYEPIFLKYARDLLLRSVELHQDADRQGSAATHTWEIERPYGRIELTPDRVVWESDGTEEPYPVFERVRAGRRTGSEADKDVYALYQQGAEAEFAGKSHKVRIHYLATGEVQDVSLSATKVSTRLKRYDNALRGIASGEYPAKPSDFECPRCANFFICPLGKLT